jgi:hypothetical protein
MEPYSNAKILADHIRQLAARERREEVADILRWRAEIMEIEASSEGDLPKLCR